MFCIKIIYTFVRQLQNDTAFSVETNIIKMELNSTYDFRKDFSYKGENFYRLPLTWRLGVTSIDLFKIRVSTWTPKADRSKQAIFYFDVKTDSEAKNIISKIKDYNFKRIQNYFEKLYLRDKKCRNTGETIEWLDTVVIPELREKFKNFNNLI